MRTLVAVALLAAPAAAQTAVEKARAAYDAGVEDFRAKRYPAALQHFERAYKLDPSPVLIYNLARAHEEMGHAALAIEHYELYLARLPDASDRADVERRIRVMRAILEREQAAEAAGPNLMPYAYLSAGVGAAVLTAGIGLGVAAADAESTHEGATTGREKRDSADDAESLSTWANVSYAVGGLLIATGVTLWLVDDDGAAVALSPTPGGAALVGHF